MPCAATKGLTTFDPSSSSAMPTTFAFEAAAISLSIGISLRHGWHHVAQKFRITTLPLRERLFKVVPSIAVSEKSGDCAPTTTSSGFGLLWLQPERIAAAITQQIALAITSLIFLDPLRVILERDLSHLFLTGNALLTLNCFVTEYRSKPDRLAATEHLIDSLRQMCFDLRSDRAHRPGVVGCLGRVAIFDMNR